MSTTQATSRRWNILVFIHQHIKEHKIAPTIREIGDALGISSTSVVNYHLQALADDGYIERRPNKPRFMKLLVKPKDLPPAVREVTGIKPEEPSALPKVKRSYFDEPGVPIVPTDEVVGLPYPLEKPRKFRR